MIAKDQNKFNCNDDPFYQFIDEYYSDDYNYNKYKKILKAGFSQEKTNYLLLVELIMAISYLNYNLDSFNRSGL
jgi:hypothetical protein